jgi:hypothetical protein
MQEALFQAESELKRAEHQVDVSLKYTRTGDVIKNIIKRIIASVDFGVEALLRFAKENKKISEIPSLPRLRVDAVRDVYANDAVLLNYMSFYNLLRRIDKSEEFKAQSEFRRPVKISVEIVDEKTQKKETVEVNIDIISDYFTKTKEFLAYIHTLIEGKKE